MQQVKACVNNEAITLRLFLAEAALQRWTNSIFFFFKKHSLYVPSPENEYTHSNQRVGQQSSNGHHVHQRFQVKQESHDSYHKGKWFKEMTLTCIYRLMLEHERASTNTGKTISWDFQIDEFHSSILQVKEQKNKQKNSVSELTAVFISIPRAVWCWAHRGVPSPYLSTRLSVCRRTQQHSSRPRGFIKAASHNISWH